uniref:Ig-like domain-containing protein n=1 Tax=Macrostomum lignano TaxID=282301 RepID=A0A1I8G5U9_9PLAT
MEHDLGFILLLLLLSSKLACNAQVCTDASHRVTVQLSRADVLRTWQPSGAHCRWWESRQSETNRFPAAVRSGPRWLVMQLRQPMMLEAVSVRDWDGQWLAAAPVGSPVSAVGASSLPLELQLEDPCRASWEAFGSNDRWRHLGRAYNKSTVRYILIKTRTNAPLRPAGPLNLTVMNSTQCPFKNLQAMKAGSLACLLVSSCSLDGSLGCLLNYSNGSTQHLRQLNSQAQPAVFKLNATSAMHDATLSCFLTDRPAERIEQTIGVL